MSVDAGGWAELADLALRKPVGAVSLLGTADAEREPRLALGPTPLLTRRELFPLPFTAFLAIISSD
jgi:hypothetical protein